MVTPDARPAIIPRIFTSDPEGLFNFITQVFAVSGEYFTDRPSDIRIGNSLVMVSGNEFRGDQTACLYVYVDDLDSVFRRAEASGVEVIETPEMQHYGDRRCTVLDRWGNLWQIAQSA